MIDWYHTSPMCPGATRTEGKIKQHLYWTVIQREVKSEIKKYETCQFSNKINCKFGHLSEKES